MAEGPTRCERLSCQPRVYSIFVRGTCLSMLPYRSRMQLDRGGWMTFMCTSDSSAIADEVRSQEVMHHHLKYWRFATRQPYTGIKAKSRHSLSDKDHQTYSFLGFDCLMSSTHEGKSGCIHTRRISIWPGSGCPWSVLPSTALPILPLPRPHRHSGSFS